MGCVSSKHDPAKHPRIFHVWNVDGDGRHLKPGRIEVTDSQLILYQKGNIVVKWPLKSLRRYGFDSEVFSFECGRRCSTGPGVYAFKCKRAQALFTILQECINNSGGGGGGGAGTSLDEQTSAGGERVHSPPPVPNGTLQNASGGSCPTVDASGYLEPIHAHSHLHYPAGPRTASTPPAAVGSPGGYVCIHSSDWPPTCCGGRSSAHHYANAEQNRVCVVHHYVNSSVVAAEVSHRCCSQQDENTYMNSPCCVDVNTNYAKLDDLLKQEQSAKMHKEEQQPFYVNVKPDAPSSSASSKCVSGQSTPTEAAPLTSPTSRCYANLSQPEEELVNYAVLDLDQNDVLVSPVSVANSPVRSPEGYAQIDFDKTVALSHSANPCPFNDDSMRKTRHNAVIPCSSMSA